MTFSDVPGIHSDHQELHRISEFWRLGRPFAELSRSLAVANGLQEKSLVDSLVLMSRSAQQLGDDLAAGVETHVHAISQALAEDAQKQTQAIKLAFAGAAQAETQAGARTLAEEVRKCIDSKSLIAGTHIFASEEYNFPAILDSYVDSLRDVGNLLHARGMSHWATRQELTASLAAMRDHLLLPGTGLLTISRTASLLTWGEFWGNDPQFAAAAWLLEPAPRRSEDTEVAVSVDCEVRCAFCGDELISEHEKRCQVSRRRVSIALDIVPLCGTCIRQAEQDPGYWNRHLDLFRANEVPAFRLIPGEGKGSSAPRGRAILRLVESQQGEEE